MVTAMDSDDNGTGDWWGPLILCLILGMYAVTLIHIVIAITITIGINIGATTISIITPIAIIKLMGIIRILSSEATGDNKATAFAIVFVVVWVGAIVITANAYLLGGNMYGGGDNDGGGMAIVMPTFFQIFLPGSMCAGVLHISHGGRCHFVRVLVQSSV